MISGNQKYASHTSPPTTEEQTKEARKRTSEMRIKNSVNGSTLKYALHLQEKELSAN